MKWFTGEDDMDLTTLLESHQATPKLDETARKVNFEDAASVHELALLL
jgi:hypothetical protein